MKIRNDLGKEKGKYCEDEFMKHSLFCKIGAGIIAI